MASDYCDRTQLRSYLGLAAGATSDDALLDDLIGRVSRFMDRFTGRWFYELSQTRQYDYQDSPRRLYLDADLLSCTKLTVDGEDIANDSYVLYPLNQSAKQWMETKYGTGDIFTWSDTPQAAIAVAGLWGWHDDYAQAWKASGDTVQNATQISASGTTLTVSSGSNFAVRQMLKIETEQVLVTAISGVNLTITRGLNGTSAATHANGKSISIWQPPTDIQHIAVRLAAWFYRQKDAPFTRTATPSLGVVIEPSILPPDILEQLKRFRRVRI